MPDTKGPSEAMLHTRPLWLYALNHLAKLGPDRQYPEVAALNTQIVAAIQTLRAALAECAEHGSDALPLLLEAYEKTGLPSPFETPATLERER